MVVDLNGKGVRFIGTDPARGRKEGKSLYFKLCASPDFHVPGYRPVSTTKDNYEYREVRINENGEGEAVISENINKRENGKYKKDSNSEYVINGSGGKEVGTDNIYVSNYGYNQEVPPPPPPDEPKKVITNSKGTKNTTIPTSIPQDQKDKIKKRIIGGLLLIPVVIPIPLAMRGCNCIGINPEEPTPISDTTAPTVDPLYDSDGITPVDPIIDNSDLNIILGIYGSNDFSPRISALSRACFDNSEGIFYDIDSFMDGDKDENIKNYLGDEFVGLSSTDGTPSSLHKALTNKYLEFSDEDKRMIDTVENVRNISMMDEEDIKKELDAKGVSYDSADSSLDLKLKLIENKSGIDLKDPDQLLQFNETFERYVETQVGLEEQAKNLYEKHKDTTEKSMPNRSDEGKETYKEESFVHNSSAREEEGNKIRDQKYLAQVSRVKTIVATKQNMYYAKPVVRTNETITREEESIKTNEEFHTSDDIYER